MQSGKLIGIDLGATNIRGGLVSGKTIDNLKANIIRRNGTAEEVLDDVFRLTDQLVDKEIVSIGIGVPSVVDTKLGIVYDAQYIPAWKEMPLKKRMEERYKVPVFVNNDANCFALGEYYYGKGQGYDSMIGVTIGTGLGSGIIINNKLYAGTNCGAGEFGMAEYLDKIYEYYCSGSFFQNVYGLNGQDVFKAAQKGEPEALRLYHEMGGHLGNAIKLMMYTYDPELIILGGSVRFAYDFFQKAMWERVMSFVFSKAKERLQIKLSDLENSGILGAAGLYHDALA
ncbi:MAG: ROK family protein [Chitinophagales bacterium]